MSWRANKHDQKARERAFERVDESSTNRKIYRAIQVCIYERQLRTQKYRNIGGCTFIGDAQLRGATWNRIKRDFKVVTEFRLLRLFVRVPVCGIYVPTYVRTYIQTYVRMYVGKIFLFDSPRFFFGESKKYLRSKEETHPSREKLLLRYFACVCACVCVWKS